MTEDLILDEKTSQRIQHALEDFILDTKARAIMVMTRGGQLIAQEGFVEGMKILSVAALLSGIFNSTLNLAKAVGEKNFPHFYQQGKRWRIYYEHIKEKFIIATFFEESALLGVVRVKMKEIKEVLKNVVEGERIRIDWGRERNVEDLIDRFFRE